MFLPIPRVLEGHQVWPPFAPLLFISYPTPSPTDDSTDPRYRKGWLDLVFIAYYVVFFSLSLARFGEQGYAIFYFSFFGAWGLRIMSHLPTWWYDCRQFWIDYPHWQMTPELKRYYLMQALTGGVTVSTSRSSGMPYTLYGRPRLFLAIVKVFNYLHLDGIQNPTFVVFIGFWTQSARSFSPSKGVWMAGWMQWQIFIPIFLLQCLNLFWYFLIWRILWRVVMGSGLKDERSDDEGDDDEDEDAALQKKKRS
ncbi:hypothetical protein BJV77DRAFT_975187 [Russula vinacea]|nr:hypothetical protein BJV77DRAFT_975187 [Russula vinacea]